MRWYHRNQGVQDSGPHTRNHGGTPGALFRRGTRYQHSDLSIEGEREIWPDCSWEEDEGRLEDTRLGKHTGLLFTASFGHYLDRLENDAIYGGDDIRVLECSVGVCHSFNLSCSCLHLDFRLLP